jgi:radical SAM protein with 4Fe4S-binding SPASM domain
MGAINQQRFFASKRTPLQTVLPRKTPYSLEISPSEYCNLRCRFCFQHDTLAIKQAGLKFGIMEMSLYKKIMSDCSAFSEPIAKIKYGTFGEPLLNKNIAVMVNMATEHPNILFTQIITNGVLLTPELSDALIDAGLNRIEISIEALSSKGYKDVACCDVDFDNLTHNIDYFHKKARGRCAVYCKIADKGIGGGESEDTFRGIFGDICDEMAIEKTINLFVGANINEWIGNVSNQGAYGQSLGHKDICTFIFTRMLINSNGDVLACCADWASQLKIGNATDESLIDVWNGKNMNYIRIMHLRKQRRNIPLCRDCNVFMEATTDDIDGFADEILARYQNET